MHNSHKSYIDPKKRYRDKKKNDPEFREKNREYSQQYRARKREAKEASELEIRKRNRKKTRQASVATERASSPAVPSTSARSRSGSPPLAGLTDNVLPLSVSDVDKTHVHRTLASCRLFADEWNKAWGPLPHWTPEILKDLREHGARGEMVIWRTAMRQRMKEGEQAAAELKSLFKVLPTDAWQVRDLWYQAMDLVSLITSGIACLRTHLEIEAFISEEHLDTATTMGSGL